MKIAYRPILFVLGVFVGGCCTVQPAPNTTVEVEEEEEAPSDRCIIQGSDEAKMWLEMRGKKYEQNRYDCI